MLERTTNNCQNSEQQEQQTNEQERTESTSSMILVYTCYCYYTKIYLLQVVKIFAAREEDFLLPFTSSCILGVDYSQNASSGHYLL